MYLWAYSYGDDKVIVTNRVISVLVDEYDDITNNRLHEQPHICKVVVVVVVGVSYWWNFYSR